MRRFLPLLLALAPAAAGAHMGGIPTTAVPTAPVGVGHVVDASYTFGWTDYDEAADTEDTTIDFFYSPVMVPTFWPGAAPKELGGTPIFKGVAEKDPTNEYTWDTSAVPAGSYFLFSIAHDPPFVIVTYSAGAVTVAHEGDPLFPAIALDEPDGQADVADERFELRWSAFDPDGTGSVKLEATTSANGEDLELVAEGLDPAEGRFEWDTSALREGDWTIKATLVDGRGLSHVAYGRAFLRIDHPAGGAGGGGAGGGGGSGGTGGSGGAAGSGASGGGGSPARDGGSGGGCAAGGAGLGLSALLALAALRRRG